MNKTKFTDRNKYKQAETTVILILGIGVFALWELGTAIFQLESTLLLFFQLGTILTALLIYYLFRRWANAEDELTTKISEKAARTTIVIYGVAMLFVAIFFGWADTTQGDAGLGLGIVTVVLESSLVYLWGLYLMSYYYYSKKLGSY